MKPFVLTCSLLCLAIPLAAQQNDRRRFESDTFSEKDRIIEAVDEAYWQLGSWFVSPRFEVGETGYDDNIFSTEAGIIDDYSTKPGLAFDTFLRLSPRWIWKNQAGYAYAYYQDLDNLRNNQLEAESRLYALFRRVYFDAGARWEQDRRRLNSEVDDRVRTERLELSSKLNTQISARGSLQFNVRAYDITIDDDEFQSELLNNLERETREYGLSYHHRFSLAWWPYLEVTRRNFTFTQRTNPRDDAQSDRALVGFRNQLEERLHFHFRLGVQALDFPAAPVADSTQLHAEAFTRYRATRQHTLELTLHRFPLFSGTSDYLYFASLRLGLNWIYQTRGGWEIGPELTIGRNDYEKPIQPVNVLRVDDIWAARFRISVPIRQSTRLELSAGYQKRDVNLPDLSDEGLTIYLDFSVLPKR